MSDLNPKIHKYKYVIRLIRPNSGKVYRIYDDFKVFAWWAREYEKRGETIELGYKIKQRDKRLISDWRPLSTAELAELTRIYP